MTENEYLDLRNFLRALNNLLPNPLGYPDIGEQIDKEIAQMAEKSQKQAQKALQITLNDALEAALELGPSAWHAMDDALQKQGVMTLMSALARYSKAIDRLSKAKHIRSEADYYLAKGYLENNFQDLSGEVRTHLSHLVVEYEEALKNVGC